MSAHFMHSSFTKPLIRQKCLQKLLKKHLFNTFKIIILTQTPPSLACSRHSDRWCSEMSRNVAIFLTLSILQFSKTIASQLYELLNISLFDFLNKDLFSLRRFRAENPKNHRSQLNELLNILLFDSTNILRKDLFENSFSEAPQKKWFF